MRQKNMVMTSAERRVKNDCACKSQQQFTQTELNHSFQCWLPAGFFLSLLFNPKDETIMFFQNTGFQ
jgi:hypothetical protein